MKSLLAENPPFSQSRYLPNRKSDCGNYFSHALVLFRNLAWYNFLHTLHSFEFEVISNSNSNSGGHIFYTVYPNRVILFALDHSFHVLSVYILCTQKFTSLLICLNSNSNQFYTCY